MSTLPVEAVTAMAPSWSSAPSGAVDLQHMTRAAMGDPQSAGVSGGAFDALVQQIQSLSTQMSSSAPQLAAMATGQSDGVETVLLNMERTRVQFDVLMSVRNRLLEAYQDMMRMQV